MQMLKRKYTLQSFIEAFCDWCEASGFPYRYDKTNDADTYILRFDIGTKWSVFYGKLMQYILQDLEVEDSEIEVTNNTVIFKIQR